MGYETDIYVGSLPLMRLDKNRPLAWLQVMGMIDCSVLGDGLVSETVTKEGIPAYFFGTDGDTKITEDRYGSKLVAVPIKQVIEGLKKLLATEKYSRAQHAYDMLRSMKKRRKGYHGMVATHCIMFGH